MAFLDTTGLEHLWAQIISKLGNKVDKVDGKGLSTNDYTTDEKTKLSGIEEGANKIIVDSELSSDSTNPAQNKVVTTAINGLNDLVGDTTVASQITNYAVAKAGDTMTGVLVADSISVATLETAQVRNIWAGTADISEVADSLNEGDIYLQYEEG